MKSKGTKLLSLLLILCMVVTTLPMTVFVEGTTGQLSEQFFDAAGGKVYYKIENDGEKDIAVITGADVSVTAVDIPGDHPKTCVNLKCGVK